MDLFLGSIESILVKITSFIKIFNFLKTLTDLFTRYESQLYKSVQVYSIHRHPVTLQNDLAWPMRDRTSFKMLILTFVSKLDTQCQFWAIGKVSNLLYLWLYLIFLTQNLWTLISNHNTGLKGGGNMTQVMSYHIVVRQGVDTVNLFSVYSCTQFVINQIFLFYIWIMNVPLSPSLPGESIQSSC